MYKKRRERIVNKLSGYCVCDGELAPSSHSSVSSCSCDEPDELDR
jgi:hypothetical protein